MMSLILVTCVFFSVFILHVAVHGYLIARGILTLKSTAVYVIGFFVLWIFYTFGLLSLPLTSVVYYVLLVLVGVMFYLTPYLGGETPASMILESFGEKRQQTFRDLMGLFTNTGLIWKRIEDLQMAGLIQKQGTHYSVTGKGKMAALLVLFYQKLFHRQLVG
ncbi:hypothetical protein A3A63_00645 [Candidatus Gottesmanbacteria bacterium RIFCSPLOWO2_01_FULL_46_9]|uniref:Uncharacterized protein n=1 Tax=Candidatus Gottesmanbacteria bacterium RIFCSPLOWO2_01_FULL_46_9 TaxID=1798394 RepID=A0A1F6B172_9BACT|nr:MAG: hypothetical protein A3A63_00645 [Candidatus Gottesmanbacteria bacterium RIFCSPLOWO2_01_FULL_46_9]